MEDSEYSSQRCLIEEPKRKSGKKNEVSVDRRVTLLQ
jgi:hypothetical protein